MTGGPPHRTFFTQLNSFAEELSVAAIAFLWDTLELGMGDTEWRREDRFKKKKDLFPGKGTLFDLQNEKKNVF